MPTPQRLPIVNSDDGVWGDIIRQYIKKEHYDDGTDNAVNGGHQNITVRAGTATAGTAPIKLTSGTLLTASEAGAVEFNSDSLYFTITTGASRRKIALYDDSAGATGDLYYRNSSGYFTRLPIGSTSQTLQVTGGVPVWDAASGDVNGPASSTDNAIARYDLTTGKIIQNSSVTIDDTGIIATPAAINSTAGGQIGATSQPLTSTAYVQSRLQNLATNGNGLLGNNYNFSPFTFDATELHGGGGSFKSTAIQSTALSDELIPVDPSKYFRLAGWAKSGNVDGSGYDSANRQYFGLSPYDIDGLVISPYYYMKWPGSTDTTLSAALNPGDTTMTVTDATGWYNSTNGYARNIVWWPYVNAKGYSHPAYTYSRNHSVLSYADAITNGAWSAGGVSGNTITLRSAWAGPALPSGTPVRNSTSGGSFKYTAASLAPVTNTWTHFEGYIGTYDTTSSGGSTTFPYGTAFVRLVFLLNYNSPVGNIIRWSDIWFSEMSSRNLEEASATSPGVVSTGTQTIAGDKTFTGNLTLSGTYGGGYATSAKTSNYTVSGSDTVIFADATSGNVTITLPAAASFSGYRFYVKRIDNAANTCTIARSSTDTIDGVTSFTLDVQYTSVMLVSNGTAWFIL